MNNKRISYFYYKLVIDFTAHNEITDKTTSIKNLTIYYLSPFNNNFLKDVSLKNKTNFEYKHAKIKIDSVREHKFNRLIIPDEVLNDIKDTCDNMEKFLLSSNYEHIGIIARAARILINRLNTPNILEMLRFYYEIDAEKPFILSNFVLFNGDYSFIIATRYNKDIREAHFIENIVKVKNEKSQLPLLKSRRYILNQFR